MRVMNKEWWPYQVEVPFEDIEQSDGMYNWCEQKVEHWYLNGNTFCFQDEKAYLMFCLKFVS